MKERSAAGLTQGRLDEILTGIRSTSVAILGDFCLDAYWMLDARGAERSVETGKLTTPVRRQHYSLGGAGNIAANLADLGVGRTYAIGVAGRDIFGKELLRQLAALKVDVSGMAEQEKDWATPVYGKPYIGDEEQSRLDFGVYNNLARETEAALEAALVRVLGKVRVVIINQQLANGIATDSMIERINRLAGRNPKHVFICDTRGRAERFKKVVFRFNAHEAARLCCGGRGLEEGISLEEALSFAGKIQRKTGRPVFVSRGARGSVVAWAGLREVVPGIQILRRTDTVGAGDTSVSAIAGALAAGAAPVEAAYLANFASAVTVQKLKTTGTANPDEIRAIGHDPDYVYRPELANDPRKARRFKGSEIEIVDESAIGGRIRHALFDHDGTISTLRQGWEPIMEDMFVRSILGPAFDDADEALYGRIVERVKDYITKSTGIQTLTQMASLVEMVREFGLVPESRVLDAAGYKRVYLKALMGKVAARLAKLKRGELDVSDFTVKGSVEFLKELRARGVRLYLASGTDDADVKREARALGYAELFDGGISGATGDAGLDVKREIVRRILAGNRLRGDAIACFGDGPVELREGKKRGALAVGVASDEVRRHGLNPDKRARLICAGADIVVSDFTQREALLGLLFAGQKAGLSPASSPGFA